MLQKFFAERAFQIFDKDKSGKVSIIEYHETLEQFCSQSVEDKVRFLFQLYDQDGIEIIIHNNYADNDG